MYEYIGEIKFGEKKKKSSDLLVTNSSRISFQTQHFKISAIVQITPQHHVTP